MKVDGITLLQMIKDGKVKEGTKIIDNGGFKYTIKDDGHLFVYCEFNNRESGNSIFISDRTFQIIEENKPIEKLKESTWEYSEGKFERMEQKINELIDRVNGGNKDV